MYFAFLDAVRKCIWNCFRPHSAISSTTFLKLCVWAQFSFTRRCVMQKKLFATNRFILVLFISVYIWLASWSIFQPFVRFQARVSKLCLLLMASLWHLDSKWPVLPPVWLPPYIPALVMHGTPGKLIPENLKQVL